MSVTRPESTQTGGQGDTACPTPPQNKGSPPFSVLAGLFDRLSSERKPEKRRKYLEGWFAHWREEIGFDLYPVLRLILPQKDRERPIYGLKEKNLAKMYIRLIPLGTKDPDAIRLMDWKRPSDRSASSGDFTQVLYEVIAQRSSVVEGTLSVEELNHVLDDLSQNIGKTDAQARILQKVFNRSTAEEQRWIVRIVLKDMTIFVKETTVLSVFHPDALDLFNICSDLKKVAWELWDPTHRLKPDDKNIQLFHSFAPMLCKRPTRHIEETVKEFDGATFLMEEKLDGERMQLHKRGGEYFYCSRKGKDYTYLYGKTVNVGSLTPFIDSAFDPRVDEIVLDGEMLVWDPISERNLPFGTLKTAAIDRSKQEHNPRPCFKVFDILYLNGRSLIQKSTKFRKRNLKSCFIPIPGRIEFILEFEGKTAKDVRMRMEDVINERGEGLILKHPDAEYVLNGRNKDWIKVKPEYMDNMGETVDVLVVGAKYGTGRRSGGVSTLICAVVDDRRRPEEDDELKYSTFVRVGTGFSYTDYVWIRGKKWKEVTTPPSWLLTADKSFEDKGDVYLDPEDSFIIKVKAAEITASTQYHMGYTMRFPRCLEIRDDLNISDCMTASGVFESLRSLKKRKMENEVAAKGNKKRKTTKRPSVMPEYSGPRLRDLEVETRLFEGMSFMVMSDPKSQTGMHDRGELMKYIHVNGGQVVQVARGESLYIIYGGSTIPYDLRVIMNKDTYDVLKPKWVLDSVYVGRLMPMTKRYFFFATSDRQLRGDYDDDAGDAPDPSGPRASKMQADSEELATESDDERAQAPASSTSSDWLNLEPPSGGVMQAAAESDTEADTDPESNFDELGTEELGGDWIQVKMERDSVGPLSDEGHSSALKQPTSKKEEPEVQMGENDDAMEYDQDLIFRHLCFYLDTPDNATKLDMPVKMKFATQMAASFTQIEKLITQHGGRVVDLDDPKLTHVVLDKRDISRRRELMSRTFKPKRRNLVLAEFIQACLDEDTLLDEIEFAP